MLEYLIRLPFLLSSLLSSPTLLVSLVIKIDLVIQPHLECAEDHDHQLAPLPFIDVLLVVPFYFLDYPDAKTLGNTV